MYTIEKKRIVRLRQEISCKVYLVANIIQIYYDTKMIKSAFLKIKKGVSNLIEGLINIF